MKQQNSCSVDKNLPESVTKVVGGSFINPNSQWYEFGQLKKRFLNMKIIKNPSLLVHITHSHRIKGKGCTVWSIRSIASY